jgi:drug/metabolite transporter (DMT)-like permease
MAGYMSGFALAIYYGVPTGLVALIADMLPLAVAVLSWPILGQALNRKQWSGSFLGLVGVLIASGASLGGMGTPPWAYALPLLGTLSLALATLLQERKAFVPLSIVRRFVFNV